LLIAFGFPPPPADTVRTILDGRPEVGISVCEPGVGGDYLREAGLAGARIITGGPGAGIRSFLGLLLRVRKSRVTTALAIGPRADLFSALIVAFSGASRKEWIVPPSARGETVRIFPLLAAGLLLGRLCVFLFTLPAVLALRFLPRRRNPLPLSPLTPPAAGPDPPVSLVVPNFNGRDLLALCLPSLEKALAAYPGGGEIIVVDDGSGDGSAEWIRAEHPRVRLIALRKNQGFPRASNRGVAAARNRFAVLLNSDIVAEPGFLHPLMVHLNDPELFAVQPRMDNWKGDGLDLGVNIGHMEDGYIRIWNEKEDSNPVPVDSSCSTLYAVGGAMAFDRAKWELLGGFDEIYHPFCWEDIDISYRAAKRGWKILYEPASRVRHLHYGTISRFFTPAYKRVIERRNELLFTWINIHSPRLWKSHLRRLPRLVLAALLRGDFAFYRGFWEAFCRVGAVAGRRCREMARSPVSDRRHFRRSLLPYQNWVKRGCRERGENEKPGLLIVNAVVPYPPNDGGKIRLFQMLKNLSGRYDIDFISFYRNSEELAGLEGIRPFCRSVKAISLNHRPRSIFSRALIPQYCQPWISPEMEKTIGELIRRRPLDLVQIDCTLMARYVRGINDHPVIFVELDAGILRFGRSYNPSERGWKKPLEFFEWMRMLRFELKLLPDFSRVVTVSREDEELLLSYCPELPLSTVTMGTDLDYFLEPYRLRENQELIYIGSMGHYPNVDAIRWFILEVLPLVRNSNPKASLTIVGSGIPDRIGDLLRRGGVSYIGEVEDVRPYLRRAAVFVAPVRLGAGMKGKVLEALAMAKPMVATSVAAGGIPVVSGGHLLIADDPRSFAGAVVRLLSDPSLRETLARNGQRLVRENFGWKSKADQMDRIYREILENTCPDYRPAGASGESVMLPSHLSTPIRPAKPGTKTSSPEGEN